MVSDVSSSKCLQFIWDVSEATKGILAASIVNPLEVIEEIVKNIDTRVTLCWDSLIDFGQPILDKLSSAQNADSAILTFAQVATDDIICLRVKLLELLHISGRDSSSDGGNTIFHNIPEIIVNSL